MARPRPPLPGPSDTTRIIADDDIAAMFNGLQEVVEATNAQPDDIPIDAGATSALSIPGSGDQGASAAPGLVPGTNGAPSAAAPDQLEWLKDETQPLPARPDDEPQFLYIAGDAGTGKSYQARLRAENFTDAILLATTGIAAVNLGGVTLNSVLRYFDTDSMRLNYEMGQLGVALGQLVQSGYRRLVIDEISMMDGRQVDLLCLAVDRYNEHYGSTMDFPLGITMTGDFAQLPPVGVDKRGKAGWDGTLYAFEAENWQRFADNTLTLTDVKRQADPAFIEAIQQVRRGDKAAVTYFRQFITPYEEQHFDGTTILARNDEVDRYNEVRMLEIRQPPIAFRSARSGEPKDQPKEWKIIPEVLTLKAGCLVMILANGYDEDRNLVYANGDLATFNRQISNHHADVILKRNGQQVTVINAQRERLKPGIPRNRRRSGNYKPGDVLASLDYMPLRVAYASTVHKSQGLSLDNVQLMINSQFWMSSGMLYVGLSRARTPQGLKIVGTPEQFAARIRVNPLIKEWL